MPTIAGLRWWGAKTQWGPSTEFNQSATCSNGVVTFAGNFEIWYGDALPPREVSDISLGDRGPWEPPGDRSQNRSRAVRPTGLRFGTEMSCHPGKVRS